MTVLNVAQLASSVIGVTAPMVLFAADDDTSVQMQNCLNEAAAMIAYDADHDWTKFKALSTITGDGATAAWDFPADYYRMLKKARLWPSSMPGASLTHYPDTDTWLGMQVSGFTPILGGWTIIGDQLNILPAIPDAATVKYYYLTANIVRDGAGAGKPTFTADDDTFPLGERLLKLAFIYRWKQDRGQDYGEAMEDYQTSLASHVGKDKGSNILIVGEQRAPAGVGYAFPGALGG